MEFLKRFRELTRWNKIPDSQDSFRLLCSDPICSLSCANLRDGKISVTSIHGDERHSYVFTKNDTAFAFIEFVNTLNEKELQNFVNIFNKSNPEFVLELSKL